MFPYSYAIDDLEDAKRSKVLREQAPDAHESQFASGGPWGTMIVRATG
jgi:hypothetical protein